MNVFFIGLIIWAIVGALVAGAFCDLTCNPDFGPLACGFLCFLAGPLIFAIYLICIVTTLLSKLDDKWFKDW